ACSAGSTRREVMASRMNAQVDFLTLYRELGIDPECSPEAFKHAYRRRVSELHPDRTGSGVAGEEALKSLNLGYAAALDFYHVHGRFPGAPAVAHNPRRPTPVPPPQPAPAPVQEYADPAAAELSTSRRQRRWLSAVLVLLVVLALASQLSGQDGDADTPPADSAPMRPRAMQAPARMPTPEQTGSLGIGMWADDVLAALGAPTDTSEGGRFWHYGPSWIRLSCREVVDWYSSPLKPLGLSSMHPGSPG